MKKEGDNLTEESKNGYLIKLHKYLHKHKSEIVLFFIGVALGVVHGG
jgi:hypothetical protein